MKYVENNHCANHRRVPVNKHKRLPRINHISSTTALGYCQTSFDSYDLSSDHGEYWTPNNLAETTPAWRDHTALIMTATRFYLNLLPERPNIWGQINPHLNNYHSDPMEIWSIFWLPDISDWWGQQEEMHAKHADHSTVACDISFIIPHGVGVEASLSLRRDIVGWRQSKPQGRHIAKTSLSDGLLEPILGLWQALTQNWIHWT